MTARLTTLWARINASYWFYPALFSLLAFALAITTIWLDRNGWAERLADMEMVMPARPQGASNMLTVIAGSMIGVASTVFSITIAAVAYASGTYGPRLLTNFMEDKGNQLSLATFIGTFVYALTVLRTVRFEDEVAASAAAATADPLPGFVPQLSLLVAYLLMGLSIMVLVYFLNHIPSSIRINHVLEGIGRRLLKAVRHEFPETNRGEVIIEPSEGATVHADGSGYIQMIDFDGLARLAKRAERKLVLTVRTGDFAHPALVLAHLCDEDGGKGELDADLAKDIRDCFSLGATRTPTQDLQFLIDELVEIALRALSPGINDPFTAITALHWLGAATAELGGRDLRLRFDEDADADQKLVVPLDDDYSHFIRRGFGAARSAVSTSRLATLVMFDCLANATLTLDDSTRHRRIEQEGESLLRQARENLSGPDLEEVEARYAGFSAKLA